MYICPVCNEEKAKAWSLALHIVNQASKPRTEHADWFARRYPDVSTYQSSSAASAILPDMEQYTEKYSEDTATLMYQEVRRIEIGLHRFVKRMLMEKLGSGEGGWWEKGIPKKIRQNCQNRREEEAGEREEPYSYTDLIDLKDILERNWGRIFNAYFERAPVKRYFEDKGDFLSALSRVNAIRNKIMHPIRYLFPEQKDLDFLRWRGEGLSVFMKLENQSSSGKRDHLG